MCWTGSQPVPWCYFSHYFLLSFGSSSFLNVFLLLCSLSTLFYPQGLFHPTNKEKHSKHFPISRRTKSGPSTRCFQSSKS